MSDLASRACDECNACCIVPPIESPALVKPAGAVCPNCALGRGCRIYPDRPEPCREFLCGWRSLPFLDGLWKPDACGLLVTPEEEDIPPDFARRMGIKIIAFRGEVDLRPKFVVDMVAGLVHGRVPTFLSVPGPVGHRFAKRLLNGALVQAAEARRGAQIEDYLVTTYRALASGPFERADQA